MSDFSSEFIKGQIACRDGKECPVGASEAFERGFATEYRLQQIETELGVNHGHH